MRRPVVLAVLTAMLAASLSVGGAAAHEAEGYAPTNEVYGKCREAFPYDHLDQCNPPARSYDWLMQFWLNALSNESATTATSDAAPQPTTDSQVDPETCLEQGDEEYLNDLVARFKAFETYANLAASTPRMALPTLLIQMGQQQIDLLSVRPSSGCIGAYVALDRWIEKSIGALQAFLAQEPDRVVAELLEESESLKQNAAINIDLAREHAGLPPRLKSTAQEPTPSPAATTPSAPNIELRDAAFRVGERNNVWWKFAYQFTLKNNTDRPITIDLVVKFLDADGFVVDDAPAYDITVPANGTKSYSDTTLIDTGEAARVVRFKVEES